jgi:hypothetical protein
MPRELVVEPEVVLQRDRGERLVLLADVHAFLGLDGLVQALGVAPALHDAAGELVDDLDLAVVTTYCWSRWNMYSALRACCRWFTSWPLIGVDVRCPGLLSIFERPSSVAAIVCLASSISKSTSGREAADRAREVLVGAGGLGAGARDDERRSGLVDEDGVHLVDDGVVMPALHAHVGARDHVVAQVVEAELGVRAIGDICGVGRRFAASSSRSG